MHKTYARKTCSSSDHSNGSSTADTMASSFDFGLREDFDSSEEAFCARLSTVAGSF